MFARYYIFCMLFWLGTMYCFPCSDIIHPISDASFDDIVQTDALIRERNFGVMEGKPITEYVNAANEAGIKKAYKFVPKGGESSTEVRERAKEFLKVSIQKNIRLQLYIDRFLRIIK